VTAYWEVWGRSIFTLIHRPCTASMRRAPIWICGWRPLGIHPCPDSVGGCDERSSSRRAFADDLPHNGAAILEKPVSDRFTQEDLSQSPTWPFKQDCKLLILNGEMSEWLKEHAWKTPPARLTGWYRNTSCRSRFNSFRLEDAPRCDAVNAGVRRQFRAHLTQFLHKSRIHLTARPGLCRQRFDRECPISA
jgi:hypothetical protein